jgi:flagellar hook protein FlgE
MATYDIGANLTTGSYQLLAQDNINVLSDNISNSSTAGYKQTEFSFQSALSSANMSVGNSEVFSQGSISNNSNPMDAAINGSGFFVTQTLSGITNYTRDGQFTLDASGNLMTSTGQFVIGTDGKTINPAALAAANAPAATATSPASTYTGFTFNATGGIVVTYSDNTSLTVPAPASIQSGIANAAALGAVNLTPTQAQTGVTYTGFTQGSTGTILSYSDGSTLTIPPITATNITAVSAATAYPAADCAKTTLNAAGSTTSNTLFGTNYLAVTITGAVRTVGGVATAATINLPAPATAGTDAALAYGTVAGFSGGGAAPATLTWTNGNGSTITGIAESPSGVGISSTGELVVTGTPSAPKAGALGGAAGIALVNFQNPNGLQQLAPGVWAWTSSASASPPTLTKPGDPGLGVLQSSALESSNADVTALMVNLLEAQRQYQATSQALKTQDQDTQTMINLR